MWLFTVLARGKESGSDAVAVVAVTEWEHAVFYLLICIMLSKNTVIWPCH